MSAPQELAKPTSSFVEVADLEKRPYEETKEVLESDYVVDKLAERRLLRRLDIRIVPITMFIYLLCFLDRSNIKLTTTTQGNAKVLNSNTGDSLVQTLHITNQQYLAALMLFLVSYTLFETPSNYMLKKFRPSRWLALLMFGWGAMTLVLGAVTNFGGLAGVRFLLGAFEAGLFPGMVYFLTFWYTPRERAVRIALILACATLAGAFGGSIAFGVGHMNGVRGLEAWRWLFLIEGAPSCVFSVVVFFTLPDYPETGALAVARGARARDEPHQGRRVAGPLEDHVGGREGDAARLAPVPPLPRLYLRGLGYEGLSAQLFTVPPYAVAFVVTVLVAWVSDRYEARSLGAFYSLVIAGVCFIVQGALPSTAFKARYGILCVAASFSFASIPPLLSWLTANLRGTGASTLAVPLNVSIGQIGQIVGIYIYKANEAPGYPTGHYVNAGFLLEGALVVLALRHVYNRRNRALGAGEKLWRM
ncbi:hypothetical protein EVG20_g2930 [Dentipellis fragilis]|uniref:Major facilitator superfamily (MFS) profile domain-containing protein n=1 Tax=Dentipellis fragilis TaxID=205917 RepID=A0A4Y9Z5G8_9AGAM|nr:hypothetical protein EVG20_g2930 [Dentipellis fragilis]